MKGVVLGITTAIFVFLLLVVLLQNQVAPPPLPPQEATFAAVSAEATRVAEDATHMAAGRIVMATTEAIQTETSQIQTRSAGEAESPPSLAGGAWFSARSGTRSIHSGRHPARW